MTDRWQEFRLTNAYDGSILTAHTPCGHHVASITSAPRRDPPGRRPRLPTHLNPPCERNSTNMKSACDCGADHAALIQARSIESESGCRVWSLALNQGYGRIVHAGHTWPAHRMSWFARFGPIPPGKVVDHLCRNRACVNPEHLEPVTGRVNTLRGEGVAARHARKSTCANGHPLTPDNVNQGKAQRFCRGCWRDKSAKRRIAGLSDDDHRHGTLAGYAAHGCRCEQCRAARRIYNEQKRKK